MCIVENIAALSSAARHKTFERSNDSVFGQRLHKGIGDLKPRRTQVGFKSKIPLILETSQIQMELDSRVLL